MSLAGIAEFAPIRFAERFGRAPEIIVAAPGRVNLIGEHTDYNDGFVLPMAIERWTVIAAARATGYWARLVSSGYPAPAALDLSARIRPGVPAWANYVRGVVSGFQERALTIPGFDAWIDSTVPIGGGLSSSAALEVAIATLMECLTGETLDPVEKALLCQQAECKFAGVPCGIMDQFTSVMGRENCLLLIDCLNRTCEYVALESGDVTVLIANSNVKHDLTTGTYAERRAQCEEASRLLKLPSLRDAGMTDLEVRKEDFDPIVFRRAQHVIGEIERTVLAAEAVRSGDWRQTGKLMYESHRSLRDQFEVSCDELDLLVDLAWEIGETGGVIGSRMTGGGFGGCTVSLVRAGAADSVAKTIRERYLAKTGIEPTLFASRPAGGTTVVRCDDKQVC
ncbi:MAG: galactokinase [Verrucomicrobia bacterium]|nr:galactokinase [Verrucomicrobiota bacterium]